MLTIVKKGRFSFDYRLFDGPDHVADLTMSRWRNAGQFTVMDCTTSFAFHAGAGRATR
jgi:hypothetical protein